MLKARLDALADGIFAIVMTLLVIDIKVPQLGGLVTNQELWLELQAIFPLFASYLLSFIILATYWMGHHYIVSLYAKNLTRTLAYLNVPFLAAVGLVPFSSHFLGRFYYTQLGILIFGINVIIIGIFLFIIARYVVNSEEIKNNPIFSDKDYHSAYVRILLPPAAAVVAILTSKYSPTLSIYIFIVAIVFNFVPSTLHVAQNMFGKLFHRLIEKDN